MEEEGENNAMKDALTQAKQEEKALRAELGEDQFDGQLDEDEDDDKNDWLQGFIEGNVVEKRNLNEEQAAEEITGIGAAPTLDPKKGKKRKAEPEEATAAGKKVKVEVTGAVTAQEILNFIRSKPAETLTTSNVTTHFKDRLHDEEAKKIFAAAFQALPIKKVKKGKKTYLKLEK